MVGRGYMLATSQVLKRRFDELVSQLDEVEKTTWQDSSSTRRHYVDDGLFVGWCVKALNLLSRACGEGSEHYRRFARIEDGEGLALTNHARMKRLQPVFLAAKEDFEGGYLRTTRSLAHAELFADELEQSRELLALGYSAPAAVVARVVLEAALRTPCVDRGIPVTTPDGKSLKLDKLNADLAKDGVYDKLAQKDVTWLAGIGNDAAHGNPVKDADVGDMIKRVERFITDHPTA
jgi:hypothetical protein